MLLVTRLVVDDPQRLLSASAGFDDIRASYGCTSVRFLRDHADPRGVLSFLEFPSLAQACAYLQLWSHADGFDWTGTGEPRTECYEDLSGSVGARPYRRRDAAVLAMRFEVGDIDRYLRVHEDERELQLTHGCVTRRLMRVAGTPSDIVVLLEFPSAKDAERYNEISLMEGALRRGGVVGTPRVEIYEERDPVQAASVGPPEGQRAIAV
jgi:hypothetical protein